MGTLGMTCGAVLSRPEHTISLAHVSLELMAVGAGQLQRGAGCLRRHRMSWAQLVAVAGLDARVMRHKAPACRGYFFAHKRHRAFLVGVPGAARENQFGPQDLMGLEGKIRC